MKTIQENPPVASAGNEAESVTGQFAGQLQERSLELQTLQAELAALRKAVRHDLAGHLMNVSGFAELLQEHCRTKLDAKGQLYAGKIVTAAEKINRSLAGIPTPPRVSVAPLSGVAGTQSAISPLNP